MEEKIHDRRSTDLPINSRHAFVEIADPYGAPGEKIIAVRSTRDDPLAGMLSRKYITTPQYEAGRRWQNLHEQSTIGAVKAIDPMKEAVDGGKLPDMLSDTQIRAFRELRFAYAAITDVRLVYEILAERITITEAAARRNMTTRWRIKRLGKRFRDELESLARHWGATGSTKKGRKYA